VVIFFFSFEVELNFLIKTCLFFPLKNAFKNKKIIFFLYFKLKFLLFSS